MTAELREIYGAPTRAAPAAAIDVFADKHRDRYDKAVACLTKDREALLAFFDLPERTGTICARQTQSRAYRHRKSSHRAHQGSTLGRKPQSS